MTPNAKRQSVRPKTGAVTIREGGSTNVSVVPPQTSRVAEARAEIDHLRSRLRIVADAALCIRRILEQDAERIPKETLEQIVAACNAALVEGLGLDGIEVAYDEQTAPGPADEDPASDTAPAAPAPTPATP